MANLNDEDRANLVAYLDGELDERAARALEARLATDPQARAEAESFRRTWEMLDYLPRAEASTTFTHRTLEKLAVRTGPQAHRLPPVGLRRLPWWLLAAGWAAALLLAAGGGLTAANLLWPRPPAVADDSAEVEAQIAQHRRVLENRRLYEHADDIEFVRALDHPDLFGDDDAAW
jgi:anti-sigma factor RsiW